MAAPKKSAVLILMHKKNEEWQISFIKRADYNGTHGGQVAFPGGKYEESDLNLKQTALRETFEEIGVAFSEIEIIHQLSDFFIPPSNFMVTPFLGICKQPPAYNPEPKEVQAVFEVPLRFILNPENTKHVEIETTYGLFKTRAIVFDQYTIWGATAGILKELVELIKAKKILVSA